MHESQEVIKEKEDETVFRIKVFITHDFIMESLIDEIKSIYKAALSQYSYKFKHLNLITIIMTMNEYEIRKNDLFDRWQKARPEYINEAEGKRFSFDGIEDFDAWKSSRPKILFLLKENCADEDNWEPCQGINMDANPFSWNITLWRQLIIDLYNNKEPSFSYDELPKHINDIALIEIKKLNEGKNQSTPVDLRQYAIRDKDFIKEQIELLNPNIILCCSTAIFYGRDIYGDEHWDCLIQDSGCKCYKHGNRLVIDFKHPSIWWGAADGRERELFDILHRMIADGRIFEKFVWS